MASAGARSFLIQKHWASCLEGAIPASQYGAGKVIIWDSGTRQPVGDASKG